MMYIGVGIIIIAFFVFLFYVLYLFDFAIGGLDFATNQPAADRIIAFIKARNLENCKFYDLGSARGGFAVKIAKALPGIHITGIDDSWLRTLLAKARSAFLKNVFFKKEDIFAVDVSRADIVYLYLPQELMPGLETKLQKELKIGSLVISHSVSFSSWPPAETYELKQDTAKIKKFFVYVKN